MRISDWSSDVCSSDLPNIGGPAVAQRFPRDSRNGNRHVAQWARSPRCCHDDGIRVVAGRGGILSNRRVTPVVLRIGRRDRKRVEKGKSVSVRVDLGGRRIIKKKHTNQLTKKER